MPLPHEPVSGWYCTEEDRFDFLEMDDHEGGWPIKNDPGLRELGGYACQITLANGQRIIVRAKQ